MTSRSWRLAFIPIIALMLAPALSHAQISVSVNIAPPELPVYDQPPIPGDGYIWTPGYWAWGDDLQDYYWVPGTWVEAPQPDYLWTPGYWAADGAAFLWHAGYWGPQVGFYGGVNYGYGYGGRGYDGGYWRDGHIFYNRSVVNVGSAHITNVYNKTVVNNIRVTRVSFNGGNGGVRAQATSAEMAAARDRHIEATSAQREHAQTARSNPELRAASNHGRPPIGATPRAGNFSNPAPARNTGPGHNEAPSRNDAPVNGNPRNNAPRNNAPRNDAPRSNEAPRNDAPSNGTPREPPHPRVTTPHPNQQAPNQQAARDAAAHDAAVRDARGDARQAHPAPPNPQSAPPPHMVQPRPAAPSPPVEPRREPEHTQEVRPAPKPQARPAPRPAERPAEHPAEHPQEHEHH